MGLNIHNSAAVVKVTAGTQAAAAIGSAGYAVGATSLALASAGTGTIIAGDIIAINGDAATFVGSPRKDQNGTFIPHNEMRRFK